MSSKFLRIFLSLFLIFRLLIALLFAHWFYLIHLLRKKELSYFLRVLNFYRDLFSLIVQSLFQVFLTKFHNSIFQEILHLMLEQFPKQYIHHFLKMALIFLN